MCRIAAWIGPARPLASLLFDPPHSLERQAYLPRELSSGHVNVDGTGVVWWRRRGDGEPLRYVTERPPWSDPNLPSLAPRLSGEVIVAAVRSATPGMPFSPSAVAPFCADGVAFAHNGFIVDFDRAVARRALERLSPERFASLQVRTDSTVLMALIADRLAADPARDLAAAQAAGTEDLAVLCADADVAANLVSVVSDGTVLCALRRAVGTAPNSLYTRMQSNGQGLWVASEPLEDVQLGLLDDAEGAHGWTPVAPDRQIVFDRDGRFDERRVLDGARDD